MTTCLVAMESLALPRVLLLNLASLRASFGEQLVIHHGDLKKLWDFLVACVNESKGDCRSFNKHLLECNSWIFVVKWEGGADITYNIDIVPMVLGCYDIDLSWNEWNAVKSWLSDFNHCDKHDGNFGQTIIDNDIDTDHAIDCFDLGDLDVDDASAEPAADASAEANDAVDAVPNLDNQSLLILRQQRQIRMLKKTIRLKNQCIRRISAKLDKQRKSYDDLIKKQSTGMEVERNIDCSKRRKTLAAKSDDNPTVRPSKLTMSGKIAVALRRNLSNIAAADLGLATCTADWGDVFFVCAMLLKELMYSCSCYPLLVTAILLVHITR